MKSLRSGFSALVFLLIVPAAASATGIMCSCRTGTRPNWVYVTVACLDNDCTKCCDHVRSSDVSTGANDGPHMVANDGSSPASSTAVKPKKSPPAKPKKK